MSNVTHDTAELITRCYKQLQECLPHMQTDENGVGPDCAGIFQLIIDLSKYLKKNRENRNDRFE